jgi:hypothetical protein
MITVDHMSGRMLAIVAAVGAWAAEVVFSEPTEKRNDERKRRRDLLRRECVRKERERLNENG